MSVLCLWVPQIEQEFIQAVLTLEHPGKVGLFLGILPDLFLSLSRDFQRAQFQNTLSFAVPYAAVRFFFSPSNSRASPGSGESVCQASYRKPARAWPSPKKSYTCCSTRLFLRNNHLYSSSIGIHLLPLR